MPTCCSRLIWTRCPRCFLTTGGAWSARASASMNCRSRERISLMRSVQRSWAVSIRVLMPSPSSADVKRMGT